MSDKPTSPIHKWLQQDAVRLDLSSEEIIQQLCEENEDMADKLAIMRKQHECVVCGAALLPNTEAPHCIDTCVPTDDDQADYEDAQTGELDGK